MKIVGEIFIVVLIGLIMIAVGSFVRIELGFLMAFSA
jgi:hypothetical protein